MVTFHIHGDLAQRPDFSVRLGDGQTSGSGCVEAFGGIKGLRRLLGQFFAWIPGGRRDLSAGRRQSRTAKEWVVGDRFRGVNPPTGKREGCAST